MKPNFETIQVPCSNAGGVRSYISKMPKTGIPMWCHCPPHICKCDPDNHIANLSGGKFENATNAEVLRACRMGNADAVAEYEHRGGAYHIHS